MSIVNLKIKGLPRSPHFLQQKVDLLLQYGGMGYASYLVMRDGGDVLSLSLYSTQLALNWAWTPIFFGSHNVKAAFFEICLLWIAVAATGANFYSVNKVIEDGMSCHVWQP